MATKLSKKRFFANPEQRELKQEEDKAEIWRADQKRAERQAIKDLGVVLKKHAKWINKQPSKKVAQCVHPLCTNNPKTEILVGLALVVPALTVALTHDVTHTVWAPVLVALPATLLAGRFFLHQRTSRWMISSSEVLETLSPMLERLNSNALTELNVEIKKLISLTSDASYSGAFWQDCMQALAPVDRAATRYAAQAQRVKELQNALNDRAQPATVDVEVHQDSVVHDGAPLSPIRRLKL